MARKKKETTVTTDDPAPAEQASATAVLETPAEPLPVAIPVVTPAETTPATTEPATNGQRRPTASWKFPAAAGVTIEVALWPHTITLSGGETIEVLNATITRSYRDAQGNWHKGGSFRVAEIPVLVHALLRAHGFALDGREMSCPI